MFRRIEGSMYSPEWVFDDECRKKAEKLRNTGFDAYCLFCMTNGELKLAQELNRLNDDCVILPFLRMMRKSENGKHSLVQDILLKGYVFAFVPKGRGLPLLKIGELCFRTLEYREGGKALRGSDLKYAELVLKQGGILDVAQAIQTNERVKIISGPFFDRQGNIVGFSKRDRNYRVRFEMMGHNVDVWLPYELVESVESCTLL